jgi:hypothetical protein
MIFGKPSNRNEHFTITITITITMTSTSTKNTLCGVRVFYGAIVKLPALKPRTVPSLLADTASW